MRACTWLVSTLAMLSVSAAISAQQGRETPVITWPAPAPIIYGAPLTDAQLNAIASTTGQFVYGPPIGTTLQAGDGQLLTTTFIPSDTMRYNVVSKSVAINVAKATPTIDWPAPLSIAVGTPLSERQLNATSSVGGTFSYSPSYSDMFAAAGAQTLSLRFAPADSANFNPVMTTVSIGVISVPIKFSSSEPTPVRDAPAKAQAVAQSGQQSVVALKEGLALTDPLVTWITPSAIVWGTPLGATQLNAAASVPGFFIYSPAGQTILEVGSGQTLSVTFTPVDMANYSSVTKKVTIDVTKRTPTLTWSNATITVGTPLSFTQLSAASSVAGSFVFTPPAGTVLPATRYLLKTGTVVTTVAGVFTPTDTAHYTNATATSVVTVNGWKRTPVARLLGRPGPGPVVVDGSGNVYIPDTSNQRIVMVSASNGAVSVIAGSGVCGFTGDGGPAVSARLCNPSSVALDRSGNLYIADTSTFRIRKVSAVTGIITTIAGTGVAGFSGDGGPATLAQIATPRYIATDALGNVYLSEGCRVRKVTSGTGIIDSVAGTGVCGTTPDGGPALATRFNQTGGVAIDASGNLWIADGSTDEGFRVRRVDANTSLVSTRFTHTNSFFSPPGALSLDDAGDVAVRAAGSSGGAFLIPANNAITPYFSSNSLQELASQSTFTGSLDAAGNLYVAYEEFTDSVASITLFKFSDQTTSAPRIGADFDGDGRSELVAYTPSTGQWLSLDSSTLYTTRHEFDPQFWGAPGDVPVLGDYDGDNRLDYAVYRPSTGAWYFIPSRTRVGVGYTWGAVGDVPVPGDYDGDGKNDLAVYRPSTGEWYFLKSSTGFAVGAGFKWGAVGDVPAQADFDGDGITDLVVYRPTTGEWYVLKSSSGFSVGAGYQWGAPGDVPVPGDYDGDGPADLAVYRPSTGEWYFRTSSSGYATAAGFKWGAVGDLPVEADYDGDGKVDLAVYRPSTSDWFILKSSSAFTVGIGYHWGKSGDIAVVVVK